MRQIAIFIAVGCAAASTHLGVVALLVEAARISPLPANAVGFCVAFFVSFAGHSRWTFPNEQGHRSNARLRFFAIALTGFVINQAAYAEALSIFGPRWYLLILAAVLLGVAAGTFLLSKIWAFAVPE